MPTPSDWSQDRRLDILLLGPMEENNVTTDELSLLEKATDTLLREKAFQDILKSRHIKTFDATQPQRLFGNDIVAAVLEQIDIADLVIFNLNPKDGQTLTSPNVFYELALVHALGIPYLNLALTGTEIPFYAGGPTRCHYVPEWTEKHLQEALRAPLLDFLNQQGSGADLAANPVSSFYQNIPLVDISAAMGLATGYYYNFVRRLLLDDGLITAYPDHIRHLIVVRPSSLQSSFNQDMQTLSATLKKAGIEWTENEYIGNKDVQPGDKMRGLAINHANGIVFDLPSTIYPLQHSPRLQSQRDKIDKLDSKPLSQFQSEQRHTQTSAALLNQIERALRHHLRRDDNQVRSQLLHFATIEEAPALIEDLND